MKTMIFGGTGTIGYEAALHLLDQGHIVEAIARRKVSMSPQFDQNVKLHLVDVFQQSDAQLIDLLTGIDTLIYASGPDDRTPHDIPVQQTLDHYLVTEVTRILRSARQAGVKKAVLAGSYFTTFHRMHPEWSLTERHPYIKARVIQSQQAITIGHEDSHLPPMDVMMLEIPYVFGVTPHRIPFWKNILFDMVLNADQVIPYYPTGGTAVITAKQAGQAAAGALQYGKHGQCYPIGDVNMTWQELIQAVLDAFDLQKTIVELPLDTAIQHGITTSNQLKEQGKESGLSLEHIHEDIMLRHLYLEQQPVFKQLNIQTGGVIEALHESIWASYPERFTQKHK